MTTQELNAYRNSIADDIMSLDNYDVLKKIKAYIAKVSKASAKDGEEELLQGLDNAVKQYKDYRNGNVKLKTLEEVLDEL